MSYTDEQRTDAVELYLAEGLAEAHHRTGIAKSTLRGWLRKAGHDPAQVDVRASDKTAAATEARRQDLERRRSDLAVDLMDDVERLRRQLFAPCVERKAVVVSEGRDMGSTVEVVDIKRDQPTFRDQQTILTSAAIAIDKIQVLTGQPSEITGHVDVPERTPEQEAELAKVVELAERRDAA